jgi:hypothetical protein
LFNDKDEHSEKQYSGKYGTEFGIVINDKDKHSEKQCSTK